MPQSVAGSLSAPVLIYPLNYAAVSSSSQDSVSWKAVGGAESYRLQVSADSTFISQTLIDVDSVISTTSFLLPTPKPGVNYYWRVLAADSTDTSAWSTTWSFTTGVPSVPVVTSPLLGSTYRPSPIVLRWHSLYARIYHVQFAVNNGAYSYSPSDILVDTTLESDSLVVGGLELDQGYYWHVSAQNSNGSSNWTSTQYFTTSPPPTVRLLSPASSQKVDPSEVAFSWLRSSGVVGYQLQVSKDPTYNLPPLIDTTVVNTSINIGPLGYGGTYYWRVRAKSNVDNYLGSWATSVFYTPPAAPVLVAPFNHGTAHAVGIVFWWKNESGVTQYQIQISSDSAYTSLVLDSTTSSAIDSIVIDTLAANSTFFWRVRGGSSSNGWGQYSPTWMFSTTSLPPGAPSLLAPRADSLILPLDVVLRWEPTAGANLYHIQLSKDSTFTSLRLNDSTITADSLAADSLSLGAIYYWRVRAGSKTAGWGRFSHFQSFTTTSYLLAAPVLKSPAEDSQNLPTSLGLHWNYVAHATRYQLQVSTHASMDSLTVNDSTVAADSAVLGSLLRGVKYYWRVRAGLSAGWSPFSPVWSFSVVPWGQSSTLSVSAQVSYVKYSDISQFKPTDYRLVGIPGSSDLPMTHFFGGTPGKDWQAYWDNGGASDYLVRYDGSDTFNLSNGRAFWVIHNGPLDISANVEASALDSLGHVKIPLHPGWNIVTDPFLINVPWDTVQAINGIATEPIWSFSGTFTAANALVPCSGYYFFNSDSLKTLVVPYIEASGNAAVSERFMKTSSGTLQWLVRISLKAGGVTDSSAWFGASGAVASTFNRLDVHKPRSLGFGPSAYFYHPEWNKKFDEFASEIHPAFSDSSRWALRVNAPAGKSTTLTFSGLQQLPQSFAAFLYSPASESWTNITQSHGYNFVPESQTTSFVLLVGRADLVNEIVRTTHATSFQLDANYPNPFNPTTTIRYQVPSDSRVTLKIFDVLGRRVATLVNGEEKAGIHTISFDGSRLSSGVYFYRLTSGSHVFTRKMVLLK